MTQALDLSHRTKSSSYSSDISSMTHSQQCHIYDAVNIATNTYINIYLSLQDLTLTSGGNKKKYQYLLSAFAA